MVFELVYSELSPHHTCSSKIDLWETSIDLPNNPHSLVSLKIWMFAVTVIWPLHWIFTWLPPPSAFSSLIAVAGDVKPVRLVCWDEHGDPQRPRSGPRGCRGWSPRHPTDVSFMSSQCQGGERVDYDACSWVDLINARHACARELL